jgi:hypothetical protein
MSRVISNFVFHIAADLVKLDTRLYSLIMPVSPLYAIRKLYSVNMFFKPFIVIESYLHWACLQTQNLYL